jgi:hypothetical protein
MTKPHVRTKNKTLGLFKSKQERTLGWLYPTLRYEPLTLDYAIHTKYTPDFYLGLHTDGKPVYLECKEWLAYEDVGKYRYFCEQYPQLHLAFLIRSAQPRTIQRLKSFAWDVELSSIDVLPTRWLPYVLHPVTQSSH